MSLVNAIQFHGLKWIRLTWYNIYYRFNKWKKIEGIYLPVYPGFGYSVLRFIYNGTYECEELNILKSKLENTDLVLELGTGIGFISSYCAQKISAENVYTFEANIFMKPVIMEVFRKNKVVPNFQVALLGDPEIEKEFSVQKSFLASSQKINNVHGKKITVPFLDLNETIKKLVPNYLVMDIEGNEYDVFSIIDFQTIWKVQFELHPDILDQEKIDFIFKKLAENNFRKDESVSTEKNFYFQRNSIQS